MHPYHRVPLTGVWSRSVATNFDPRALVRTSTRLVRPHERVASAGSCFAANLVPYLEKYGLTYLRTESLPPALSRIPGEHAGYDAFSARYGHIYTVRQLLQLWKRSMGLLTPIEDRWHTPKGVIDPFRPGLRYHALTDREFDLLTSQHLRAVRAMFEQMDVFIFTLGLTEAWVSRADGCVFPACPGTVAGEFDESRHEFVNFGVAEMSADLGELIEGLRAVNPRVRIILSVSPVPLVATATNNHVLCATTYSKSALRVVAEEASRRYPRVTYFPAYEIVTGVQAPASFYMDNLREVSEEAIYTVMFAFLSHCQLDVPLPASPHDAAMTVTASGRTAPAPDVRQRLSAAIVARECEEVQQDVYR
jgi:hypothetical protein